MLVDFWTYSCINCLRTLPHLQAWYAAYHRDGLVIVGVHTPEFAFEHVLGNVGARSRRLGVTWPVALDNNYATWNAYSNEYWPADYLIDRRGRPRDPLRRGRLRETEAEIRTLLGVERRRHRASPNTTPTVAITPETYLGPGASTRAATSARRIVTGQAGRVHARRPRAEDSISYGGEWTLSGQSARAGTGARLELRFNAQDVYIVLGGKGRVTTLLDGKPLGSIDVNADRLYTVLSARASTRDGLLGSASRPASRRTASPSGEGLTHF